MTDLQTEYADTLHELHKVEHRLMQLRAKLIKIENDMNAQMADDIYKSEKDREAERVWKEIMKHE